MIDNCHIYRVFNGQRAVWLPSLTQSQSALNLLRRHPAWAVGNVTVHRIRMTACPSPVSVCYVLNGKATLKCDTSNLLWEGEVFGDKEASPTVESSLRLMGFKPLSEGSDDVEG